MRKIKKALALSLALAMGLSLVACSDNEETTDTEATTTEEETTAEADAEEDADVDEDSEEAESTGFDTSAINDEKIYVYSWNEELGTRLEELFYTRYPEYEDLVEYVNLNVSGTESEYPAKIQNAVDDGTEYPSVFASDESVMLSFAAKDYTAPVSEAGITSDMYSNAFQYTVDFATVDGELMACTWQSTPGILLYNVDIAEEVLGTSDQTEVGDMLSDWDGFFDVAEQMKSAGYYMVSGYDDIKYPLIESKDSAWVVDGALNIPDMVSEYLELSKQIYDGGYCAGSAQWDSAWYDNMQNGTVFCYFGTTWFMPDTVFNTGDLTYSYCAGPAGYYWGGSYLCYGVDSPNPALAGLVIYTLTCDSEAAYDLITVSGDFPNNTVAIEQAIANGDSLAGYDGILETFYESAQMIDMSNSTQYDSQINTSLSTVCSSYVTGEYASTDEAIAALKADVAASVTAITVE